MEKCSCPVPPRKTSLETRTARLARRVRRAPYYVKIAKGLHLGYYRGPAAGTWQASRYRGAGVYDITVLGTADDTLTVDSIKVFDFWQAQNAAKVWDERKRLVDAGLVRSGPYHVRDAVADYLEEIRAEKRPETVAAHGTCSTLSLSRSSASFLAKNFRTIV